jgi:hypothetical protein
MNDLEVAKLCKKQRNISKRNLSPQWENTELCQQYYNGEPQTYSDQIQFEDTMGRRKRALVNFNKVQSNVDAVVGFMAQNRRQAKFIARVNANQGQQLYSKNMNALYSFHRENTHSDQLETDQDADMMTCGYGAIETDLSYIMGNATTDPNGEIVKLKIDPMRVGWDPNARAKNLLDARWVYYFEDFDLKEALDLFQGSKESDFELVAESETGDTGYVFNPWGGLYDKIKMLDSVEWAAKEQEMVRVYNHQWFEYETFYRADNPLYDAQTPEDALFIMAKLDVIKSQVKDQYPDGIQTGDLFDFDPKAQEITFDEPTKRALVREFGDLINPVGFKRKCYYTAVLSGDHVFAKFKSISQQGFSIKFKTGVFNETGKFWIGMINSMMEPQKYYNKAVTEFIFTVASMSKGGVLVEESAVEDIADFESKWAKTDAVIQVSDGAIANNRILQKAQAALPNGIDTIIQLSDAALASAGVDPSFLGQMETQDQSGILYKRRIRQVISKMARYFDSITLYQKEDARLHADLIPVWVQNNNGKWVHITGELGADEFVQITEDMIAAEYDVSIQEAPQTPEDKQEIAAVLGTYGDKLATTGNMAAATQFYAESLQMLPIDGDVKNRLVQVLQPQGPQIDPAYVQKLEQQLQELTSEAARAQTDKTKSEAVFNLARAEQTRVNNELVKSKIPLTEAQTVKTMEEAARTSVEADQAAKAPEKSVNVSV